MVTKRKHLIKSRKCKIKTIKMSGGIFNTSKLSKRTKFAKFFGYKTKEYKEHKEQEEKEIKERKEQEEKEIEAQKIKEAEELKQAQEAQDAQIRRNAKPPYITPKESRKYPKSILRTDYQPSSFNIGQPMRPIYLTNNENNYSNDFTKLSKQKEKSVRKIRRNIVNREAKSNKRNPFIEKQRPSRLRFAININSSEA